MLETILFVILSTLLFGTVRYFLWFKKHNIPGLWFFFVLIHSIFTLARAERVPDHLQHDRNDGQQSGQLKYIFLYLLSSFIIPQKKERRQEHMLELVRKYSSDVIMFTIPWRRNGALLLSGGADVEHILSTRFENYDKTLKELFVDFLGEGIFNTRHTGEDKERWKEQRKEASHLFKAKDMKTSIFHSFLSHGKKLAEILGIKSESGEVADMQDLFSSLTLDTSCELFFGVEMHSLQSFLSSFQERTKHAQFATCFNEISVLTRKRLQNPLWKFWKCEYFLLLFCETFF